jgi:hypothetical protein
MYGYRVGILLISEIGPRGQFPAGDFNILAQNIFEIWAKAPKIAIFLYPLAH